MAEEAAAPAVNQEAQTTPAESAPVKENVTAANALDDDSFDDVEVSEDTESDDADESDDSEQEQQVTEETKTEQPQTEEKPLTEKSQNRFQKLANENRELKEQLERLQSQEAQVATEQNLLNEINPETGDYFTPQEAERVARQQTLETMQQQAAQQRYELEVKQSQQMIGNESVQAVNDFPMFNPESKDYNPEIAAQFDEVLGENLIYEMPDGNRYTAATLAANGVDLNSPQVRLLGSNISPYKLAKLIADSTKANAGVYQANAQRFTERMLANADALGGNTQSSKDADLDDFDKAWDE
jgi:hypothetical protein